MSCKNNIKALNYFKVFKTQIEKVTFYPHEINVPENWGLHQITLQGLFHF